MAALLRGGAARRLGGSMVQRAQAAVAQEPRQLGPRLMHTDESVRKKVMLEIQQKKDELYDEICRAEKDMITNWGNRRLLQYLSVQVTPRPDGSTWLRVRTVTRLKSMFENAGYVSLSSIVAAMIYLEWPAEEKAAQAVLTSKGSGDDI